MKRFILYSRILVVRALQLGDLLCAVPALRALRRWQSDAQITLCGLPWAQEFATRFSHLIDSFETFPGFPGIPESVFNTEHWLRWTERVSARPYDLIVQLHGSGTFINDFVRSLGGRHTAGFHPSNQQLLALDTSLPWPETGHEIERLKAIVLQLGAKDCGNDLELPLTPDEKKAARVRMQEAGWDGDQPYMCLHVGGRSLSRRWPIEKYASVAEELLTLGWAITLTGVQSERHLASQLNEMVSGRCFNLAGRTTFGEMVGVIDGAELVISNDTATSHIAAARQVPSVIIVLGSEPSRWFPLDRNLHLPVMADVPCRPCFYSPCPVGFTCAQHVTVDMVLEAIQQQLSLSSSLLSN